MSKETVTTLKVHRPSLERNCPFCGSEGEYGIEFYIQDCVRTRRPIVICKNDECGAYISGKTRNDVIVKWNKRNNL